MLQLAIDATAMAIASTIRVRFVRFISDLPYSSWDFYPHLGAGRKRLARRKDFADQRDHRPDEEIVIRVIDAHSNDRKRRAAATGSDSECCDRRVWCPRQPRGR